MLKILLIDDEPVTRKGIRLLLPWAKYNMEIIGEASNGKKALEFLSDHDADIAIVDIDMPVMDGITFIKAAQKLYPHLNYVVLSIHTEFEYLQSTLRLGVIDYISKLQLDQENFDQILERISHGIAQKKDLQSNASSLNWKKQKIPSSYIYALMSASSESEETIIQFSHLNNLQEGTDFYELTIGTWLFRYILEEPKLPPVLTNACLIKITDILDSTYDSIGKLLKEYQKSKFFYDYDPDIHTYTKSIMELNTTNPNFDSAILSSLHTEWMALKWVYDKALFEKMKFDLKNLHLSFSALHHLLVALEYKWNSVFSNIVGQTIKIPQDIFSWTDADVWFTQLYDTVNNFQRYSGYSSDITQNILCCKQYIDEHFSNSLKMTQMAKDAHMSCGYFSKCFHDIVGMPFNNYYIYVRIEHAKEQLLHTNNSIQQISYDIGYSDEKYFSRLFKQNTGYSPSDYREKYK